MCGLSCEMRRKELLRDWTFLIKAADASEGRLERKAE